MTRAPRRSPPWFFPFSILLSESKTLVAFPAFFLLVYGYLLLDTFPGSFLAFASLLELFVPMSFFHRDPLSDALRSPCGP